MTIYVISPEYLEALTEECRGYTFNLQGYGSFANGIIGLRTVNSSDIGGFICFTSKFKMTEDAEHFMQLCNAICSTQKKKFLFVLPHPAQIAQIDFSQYKNLSVRFLRFQPDGVTDTFINHEVFGSIILDQDQPYSLQDTTRIPVEIKPATGIHYEPLFSPTVLQVISPVSVTGDLEQILKYDNSYLMLKKEDAVLAELRQLYIKRTLNLLSYDDVSRVVQQCTGISDPTDFCTKMALVELITEGG